MSIYNITKSTMLSFGLLSGHMPLGFALSVSHTENKIIVLNT